MEESLASTLTGWRRHLHRHPELSRSEHGTAAFVAARLAELGVPHQTGIGGAGVVGTLTRGASNRCVGLRADMDALPIIEATGLAYASANHGVMHACGHDGHTTSLLGAAALLAADPNWQGTVQFVFQPAEEGQGGALAMIADGLFERFPMERVFGYHNWPGIDAGVVVVHDGPVMSSGARMEIVLEGHAGHAAMPHLTRDPVLAAAHLTVALQSVVSRQIDPLEAAVVSVTMIDGGSAPNQIPHQATLQGTFRTFKPAVRDRVEEAIRQITSGVAQTFGMTAQITVRHGAGATVNSPAEAAMAAEAAAAAGLTLRRDIPPTMASEDFGQYLQHRPGVFAWIGNGPAENGRGLHNARYDFNDAILPAAAAWLASVAKRAL
jgi:amidohydrolase